VNIAVGIPILWYETALIQSMLGNIFFFAPHHGFDTVGDVEEGRALVFLESLRATSRITA
jgi:hypothetical protein